MHTPILLFALFIIPTFAEEIPNPVEEDNTLCPGLVSPHVPWAKGYALGKVKALFFVRGLRGDKQWIAPESKLRPIIELAQRFDIEAEVVILGLGQTLHGKAGEERAVRLLKKPYDVFVSTVPLGQLQAKTQYFILEQVRDGAGLVCFGPPYKEVMTEERKMPRPLDTFLTAPSGLTALPTFRNRPSNTSAAKSLLMCYRLGDGRAVHVRSDFLSPLKLDQADMATLVNLYEYWALFSGRTILWAAGKEAQVKISGGIANGKPIEQSDLSQRQIPVSLRNVSGKQLKLTLKMSLNRADGLTLPLPETEIELAGRGRKTIQIKLPHLRAGHHILRVIGSGERGVETFGALAFEVASRVSIKDVTLDQEFIEKGELITGKIALNGKVRPNAKVAVRLRDSFGRVLANQVLPASGTREGKLIFSLPVNEFATVLMRAEASLMDEGKEIASASAEFTVPNRRRGRFHFVVWDFPSSPIGYWGALQLRDAGFNFTLSGIPSSRMADATNMSYIPYTTRIMDALDENGVMKPVCWNDDKAADAYVNGIADKYQPTRKRGVFVYSLGDEVSTKGCCLSPACQSAYRKYLKGQYGTLGALNESWGLKLKSFEEVKVPAGDNMETAALQQGEFARWYDRQAFARYNMAQFCARFHRAFKERDPLAITGFEGAGRFGDDYDELVDTNGFWSPYPSIGDEVLRSLAPQGYIHANWTGYSRRADPLIARNWRAITRGFNGIWWWRWDGAGRWRGYIKPDFDLWPATKELTGEMKIVREGLGDLLIQCEMPHSGVALYYSMPSFFSNNLDNSDSFAKYNDAHSTWIYSTLDNQLPFRYTTRKRILSGDLTKGVYKVLVLPFTQAIGPAEAKALRGFVNSGGFLIADIRPGVFDHHCKPLQTGSIDELFGIKRIGRTGAKKVSLNLKTELNGQPLALSLDETIVDADVQPADAKPLAMAGGIPIMLTREIGKGRTLLLNFAVPETYAKRRHLESSDAFRTFIAGLFGTANVKSPVRISRKEGGSVRATEVAVFRTGDMDLLSVMPVSSEDWSIPHDVIIELPNEREVYDLRARKHLGRTRQFAATLRTGRATFFALLPNKAETFSASLHKTRFAPGEVATLKLGLSNFKNATTTAFVQGYDSEGRMLPYLKEVVILKNGTGFFRFPIPFNQASGKITLHATELISGKSVEATCEVSP